MSQPALQFDLAYSNEPTVLVAARVLAADLADGNALSRQRISAVLTDAFGGSDADGRWSASDANTSCELAQCIWLCSQTEFNADTAPAESDGLIARLEALVPNQTNRSEQQVELQQFATPPRLAWLAARACAFRTGDTVLEPSAGTGLLALWLHKAGAKLAINELSSERAACLSGLAGAAGGEGSRGKIKGSEQGVAGIRLQNLLPRARVVYASATGASDINNLAYQPDKAPMLAGWPVGAG